MGADASLSDNYTSNRCCFISLIVVKLIADEVKIFLFQIDQILGIQIVSNKENILELKLEILAI